MQKIDTIAVCGAGTMGSGIAQVAVQSGFKTILYDISGEMLQKGREAIHFALNRLAEKQKINEADKEAALKRLKVTDQLQHCKADIVIEAVIEQKEAKLSLFNSLSEFNGPATIFATNTSSISITDIAAGTAGSSRVVGMHFFNPAPVMKLVEVIKASQTGDETVQTVFMLAKQMNKVPVICSDSPGFIVNRIARHYYLEAMKMVEDGLCDIATVDAVMEAAGFKMGPFKLMDMIGLDVNYAVSNIIWEGMGKPGRLKPSEWQKAKVDKGETGRKAGKGFYEY